MIITKSNKKPFFHLSKKGKWATFLIVALALVLTAFWAPSELPIFTESGSDEFFAKRYPKIKVRYDEMNEEKFLPITSKAVYETVYSNTKKFFAGESVPHMNINIDFESWDALKKERGEMLGKTFMPVEKAKYKATIQYQGKTIPVKLRMKGERTDHVKYPKRWSYRIKTRKGKTIFGMKKFSIQHPNTKGFQREAIFLELAKEMGILSLRYFFVRVSINGEDIGIMAVEEFPSKEQLEDSERKEGHLFKLDDSNVPLLYHSVFASKVKDANGNIEKIKKTTRMGAIYSGPYSRVHRVYYNAINAPIKTITESKSSAMYSQEATAIKLMKSVMEGKLSPSAVFDIEKTGKYFAYVSLWGNSHSASFRNISYYFNPYTYRFEPVAFDSNARSSNVLRLFPEKSIYRDHELNRIVLKDPEIMASYINEVRALETLSKESGFLEKLRDIERKHLDDLREEFLFLPEMELTSLQRSIKEISAQIDSGEFFEVRHERKNTKEDPVPLVLPENYIAPTVINANLIEVDGKTFLEIHNLFPLETYVTNLDIEINKRPVNFSSFSSQDLPLTIPPFYYNEYLTHTRIELIDFPADAKVKIKGKVKIATQAHVEYDFDVGVSYASTDAHPLKSMSSSEIVGKFNFIEYNTADNAFSIKPGTWRIAEKIVFPAGASLNLLANTKLLFEADAGVLLKGALRANGEQGQEIIFDSIDGTLERAWAGLTVMESDERSFLNHVIIKNTNFTKHNGWELTGGVTFYKSNVDIVNTSFENTIAEDALNIVASEFTLDKSKVFGSRSDGFDGDYVTGKISNSEFNDIGGDGIDFSGSDILAVNTSFGNIHDKAISVGEASKFEGQSLNVVNSGTGIAVKDGSEALISKSKFESIGYATMMSYTKKSVYGISKLTASIIEYDESENSIIAQGNNRVSLDGKEVSRRKVDIEKLYKQGYMKK